MSNTLLPVVATRRPPWNKGRLVGQKRPLQPKQVWAIRARLELAGNLRDLAMFNMAIDSKLRGCDLVRLKVADLVSGDRVRDRVTIIQSKTNRSVQFEMSENARIHLELGKQPRDARVCLSLSKSDTRQTACINAAICTPGS